jgi:hypothetical protein
MMTPGVDPEVLDLLLLPLYRFLTILLKFFVMQQLAREATEGRRGVMGNGAGRRTAAGGLPNEFLEESLAVQVPLPLKPPLPTLSGQQVPTRPAQQVTKQPTLLVPTLPAQVLKLPGTPEPTHLPPAELQAPAPQAQVPKLQEPRESTLPEEEL